LLKLKTKITCEEARRTKNHAMILETIIERKN